MVNHTLYQGDCLEVLAGLADNSIDAVITDPPSGISFMGLHWDNNKGGRDQWIDWLSDIMEQCYRVLKPGGHAFVWALPRTSHWTGQALELAGFEVRDCISSLYDSGRDVTAFLETLSAEQRNMLEIILANSDSSFNSALHIFGQGFPKSHNVSVAIDKSKQDEWLNIRKAIDNMQVLSIINIWKIYSSNAQYVEIQSPEILKKAIVTMQPKNFAVWPVLLLEEKKQPHQISPNTLSCVTHVETKSQKKKIEIGSNMLKNDFAQGSVVLSFKATNCYASAIIAELGFIVQNHMQTKGNLFTAQGSVDTCTKPLQPIATLAESQLLNQSHNQGIVDFSVQCNVKESQSANMVVKIKAEEVLKTLHGKMPLSSEIVTSVLCVALTDILKLTILSQSKTFLSLDTTSQMECVSAITVTTTEYMAECLILSMVDILKSELSIKTAQFSREVVGQKAVHADEWTANGRERLANGLSSYEIPITAPASPEAKAFSGWGSSLKPAAENWWLVRKPLSEPTIAANVLRWGVGGLNIDASRVPTGDDENFAKNWDRETIGDMSGGKYHHQSERIAQRYSAPTGRFPSNIIHDGSDTVEAEFAKAGVRSSGVAIRRNGNQAKGLFPVAIAEGSADMGYGDTGTPSRFFYCAKPSSRERNEGLEGFEETGKGSLVKLRDNLTKEQVDYVTTELRRCGVIP